MKTGDKVLVKYGGQKVVAVIERCWALDEAVQYLIWGDYI